MKSSIPPHFQTPTRIGVVVGGTGLVLGAILLGLHAANRSLPPLVLPVGSAIAAITLGGGVCAAVGSAMSTRGEGDYLPELPVDEPMERPPTVPLPTGWEGRGQGYVVSLDVGDVWIQGVNRMTDYVQPPSDPAPYAAPYEVPAELEQSVPAPTPSVSENYLVQEDVWADPQPMPAASMEPAQIGFDDRFTAFQFDDLDNSDLGDTLPRLDLTHDYSRSGGRV